MRLATACFLLLTMTGCYQSPVQQATDSNQQTSPVQSTAGNTESNEAAFLADALQQVQAGTALLVDVRTNEEWDKAHFAIAKHIPVDEVKEDAETAFGAIKKDQTVFIH